MRKKIEYPVSNLLIQPLAPDDAPVFIILWGK